MASASTKWLTVPTNSSLHLHTEHCPREISELVFLRLGPSVDKMVDSPKLTPHYYFARDIFPRHCTCIVAFIFPEQLFFRDEVPRRFHLGTNAGVECIALGESLRHFRGREASLAQTTAVYTPKVRIKATTGCYNSNYQVRVFTISPSFDNNKNG